MVAPFDYTGIAGTASELLERFGKSAGFIRTTPTVTSNPAAGTVSYGAKTDTPVEAVQVAHNERYTPGAMIQDGDLFWVLDARANVEDELFINSVQYKVAQVWPTKPGDTFITCRVQTRGGVRVPVPDNALYNVDGEPLKNVDGEYIETVD